jgi:hypothetical protein
MYSMDDIKLALRVYNFLQQHGELTIDQDKELYNSFNENNVRDILIEVGEEVQVHIKKYDDTIYLIPYVDNEFLGYKRAELKREIFGRTDIRNIEYFLSMYIIIVLISEFYSGRGSNVRTRDLIDIGEIDEKITDKLEFLQEKDIKILEEETSLAISDIAKYWFTLINEDDSTKIRTRRWYIYQICRFLKSENLVNIQDETVIIPTNKMNRLVLNYFLDYERLSEINRILDSKKEDSGDVNNA